MVKKEVIVSTFIVIAVLFIAGCQEYLNKEAVGSGLSSPSGGNACPGYDYCLSNYYEDNRCQSCYEYMQGQNEDYLAYKLPEQVLEARRPAFTDEEAADRFRARSDAQSGSNDIPNNILSGGDQQALAEALSNAPQIITTEIKPYEKLLEKARDNVKIACLSTIKSKLKTVGLSHYNPVHDVYVPSYDDLSGYDYEVVYKLGVRYGNNEFQRVEVPEGFDAIDYAQQSDVLGGILAALNTRLNYELSVSPMIDKGSKIQTDDGYTRSISFSSYNGDKRYEVVYDNYPGSKYSQHTFTEPPDALNALLFPDGTVFTDTNPYAKQEQEYTVKIYAKEGGSYKLDSTFTYIDGECLNSFVYSSTDEGDEKQDYQELNDLHTEIMRRRYPPEVFPWGTGSDKSTTGEQPLEPGSLGGSVRPGF